MTIRQLTAAVAILTCWAGCQEIAFGQAPGTGATVEESSESANLSGISETDIGSFEASADSEGSVVPSAEDTSNMLRELSGTDQRQRSVDMNVENLNERRRARNRRRSQRTPPPPIHVQFRPSFNLLRTPPVQVANGMQTRLSSLLEKRDAGSVSVVLNDRTATLTGTVKSDYDRRLLEVMARIEPGVSAVESLITVEGQVAPPPAPAP